MGTNGAFEKLTDYDRDFLRSFEGCSLRKTCCAIESLPDNGITRRVHDGREPEVGRSKFRLRCPLFEARRTDSRAKHIGECAGNDFAWLVDHKRMD